MPKDRALNRAYAPNRRHASQARSRATVQRILDAAIALAIEQGADCVTMTEIARRADVVIGALYRYFADKAAINRAILQRHYHEVAEWLRETLSPVRSAEEFVAATQVAYDQYSERHLHDPVFRIIWSIVQTDSELQALDVQDTLNNARFFCSICRPFYPTVNRQKLLATCIFLIHFAAGSSRLAMELPKPLGRQTRLIYRETIASLFDELS